MSIFSQLKDKVTGYIDVHLKLIKINFIERTSSLLSYFIFSMIVILIVFCMALFTGFGLTEEFVELGLSKAVSFFITVGIYLLLLIIVVALRKKIMRFFAGEIINVMTEGDNDDIPEEEA